MTTFTPVGDFHPDLIDALATQAASEAEDVSFILKSWQAKPPHGSSGALVVARWPRSVLLAMNLMIRFKRWEQLGTCFHMEAGLPRSDEIISHVLQFETSEERQRVLQHFHVVSLKLFCDHFVWIAKSECQIDLGILNVLNDEELDAIADFLWDNRHALISGELS